MVPNSLSISPIPKSSIAHAINSATNRLSRSLKFILCWKRKITAGTSLGCSKAECQISLKGRARKQEFQWHVASIAGASKNSHIQGTHQQIGSANGLQRLQGEEKFSQTSQGCPGIFGSQSRSRSQIK